MPWYVLVLCICAPSFLLLRADSDGKWTSNKLMYPWSGLLRLVCPASSMVDWLTRCAWILIQLWICVYTHKETERDVHRTPAVLSSWCTSHLLWNPNFSSLAGDCASRSQVLGNLFLQALCEQVFRCCFRSYLVVLLSVASWAWWVLIEYIYIYIYMCVSMMMVLHKNFSACCV